MSPSATAPSDSSGSQILQSSLPDHPPSTDIREITFSQIPQMTPVIPILIQDLSISATLDTGAQMSIMKESVFNQLSPKPDLVEPVRLNLAGRNSYMPAYMSSPVPFKIGNTEFRHPFLIAPIGDALLLGMDVFKPNGIKLDFESNQLITRKESVPIQLFRDDQGKPRRVSRAYLSRRVRVPANSVVQTAAASGLNEGFDVMFESKGNLKGLLAPRVVTKSAPEVMIQLTNCSDTPKLLKKGTFVGFVSELDENDEVLDESSETDPSPLDFSSPLPEVLTRNTTTSPASDEEISIAILELRVASHLRKLFRDSCKNLSASQAKSLADFFIEFEPVFAKDDDDLGSFTEIRHKIDTGDSPPVKEQMRRTPKQFQGEEEKHLKKMLDAGVIRESNSEWASAPVLIRKRDGSVRYCIDYRKLNNVTRKDAYPLPNIQECLDALSGNLFFSNLDMQSGYWQLFVDPNDIHKTAFITKYGLFEHVRLPFGLCNSPATFSRAMQLVLRGLSWKTVLSYLDDISVLGRSFEEHLENLKAVFTRLKQFNLKLKPRKCSLFQTEMVYLGRKVTRDGISVQPGHVEKIKNWPVPKSVNEVERFVGFLNYYREFIPDFGSISACLYEICGSKAKFAWTDDRQEAYEILRKKLINAPTLGFPNDTDDFILDTDASDKGIGAVLSQVDSAGTERVISYGSLTLTPLQRRYCATRKELLAVVRFTQHFRHHLLGKRFLLRTDHNSLTWLTRFKHIQGQLARWLEELSQYDMHMVYRPGKLHVNADAMSRIPDTMDECNFYRPGRNLTSLPCFQNGEACKYCTRAHEQWSRFEEDVDDVIPLSQTPSGALRLVQTTTDHLSKLSVTDDIEAHLTDFEEQLDEMSDSDLREVNVADAGEQWQTGHSVEDLASSQDADPVLSKLSEWLTQGDVSQAEYALASPALKKFWQFREQIELRDGLLYYVWDNAPLPSTHLFMVPRSMVPEVLSLCHDSLTGGHLGISKTYARLRKHFMWYGMFIDCKLYVQTCLTCGLQKKPSRRQRAPMQLYHVGAPLERVHMDILGPLVRSQKGNLYILVIVDQFSKWVECIPVPDISAETTARVVVNEFISRFGCPLMIFTDQGRNFDGELFRCLCKLLEIRKVRTTPYMPAPNGQVERYNRLLCQMIRCFLRHRQNTWDEYLPQLAASIRATPHRQTGFTPNMLMLGREVWSPIDLTFRPCLDKVKDRTAAEFLKDLRDTLVSIHEITRENLSQSQQYEKKRYDLLLCESQYSVGDIVFRLNHTSKLHESAKLKSPWEGPFVVTEVLSPVLVKIKNQRREFVVHHNNICPRTLRDVPLWVTRIRRRLKDDEDGPPPIDLDDTDTSYGLDLLFDNSDTANLTPPSDQSFSLIDPPLLVQDKAGKTKKRVENRNPASPVVPPLDIPTQTTRAGRKTKVPGHLFNFF